MKKNLITSPAVRLRTRARAGVYRAAIELAGRGLFWPAFSLLIVVGAVAAVLLFSPAVALIGHWSLWLFPAGLLLSGILTLTLNSELWALMWVWNLGHLIVGTPTLIWASGPGLGGGVRELATWTVFFGICLFITGLLLRFDRAARSDHADFPIAACGIGFVIGVVVFMCLYGITSHPEPGDWWCAPAFAAAGGAAAMAFLRIRSAPNNRKRDWPDQ